MCIDVIFPRHYAELDKNLVVQALRPHLHSTSFYGSQGLYAAPDAIILDVNNAMGLSHFWPLCTQMLVLSQSRALVLSDASRDTWVEVMDHVLAVDPVSAASRLRWKPSRGGRPVATPSATRAATAAIRRKAHKQPAAIDHLTEITVRGELGKEDREVMNLLMGHLASSTGLAISAKPEAKALSHGEYEHVPAEIHGGVGGRVRLLLRDAGEVARVHAALHGQVVAIGHTKIGIEVVNERFDLNQGTGNGARRRA